MENTEIVKTKNNQWLKKFAPIWVAQLFSLLGSTLVQFSLVWYMTKTTGSATVLTTATIVAILPDVFLAPFAGVLVDRWNRRMVMIFSEVIRASCTVILVLLFATGKIQIWHIFIALFLRETCSIFQWPSMTASTALMVPEEHLSRVAGINQAIRNSMMIVSAPLGALLMSVLPFYEVIAVDIITAMIGIMPLCFIKIPQPVRKDENEKVSFNGIFSDLSEGFKFMKSWPGLLLLTAGCAFINFVFAPIDTLTPLLVTKYFQKGVWELSILQSTFGFGVILGGLVLGVWGGFKKKMVTSMLGVIGIGAGVFLVGVAPANAFWMGVAGYTFCGFMNPICNGPMMAIIQSKVPPEMQGRVMSFINCLCMSMMPLGLLVATPVVNLTSLSTWYWACGLITLAFGFFGLMSGKLRALEESSSTIQNVAVTVE